MNSILPQRMVRPKDRSRVSLVADRTNTDEFEGDLEKYEHLEVLAELFFAAKRDHPNVLACAQP